MAVVTHNGWAEPFDADGQPGTAFGAFTPALRGFRLQFPWGRDKELVLIQVLAGGHAEDVNPLLSSPGDPPAPVEVQPVNVPDGRLQVALQDGDPSGEEFHYDVSHSVMNVSGARYQIRDAGCVGQCERRLPQSILGGVGPRPPGTQPLIALVGFKLFFLANRQHELDRIGVWFTGDELNVALRDESLGLTDTFAYVVDFVVIPTFGLNVSTGVLRGTARAFETVPLVTPPRANFMLTGWAFNFQPGDREIHDIGVLKSRDAFTVFYGDNGGGEPFDWRISWAHVAPQVFAQAQP
jgi:hypothetical protein